MRLGSMCSGAGGLDLAVESVFAATTAWHCEIDAAASKVLAHRWPGVPNHRDLIATDWTTVEPVDVLCAGWPCQPFSLAGKQKGAADERAIWPHIARAIRILRPRYVVLENVSAVLRVEFGRVADSLAACGYDLRWTCAKASDVGAPHRRERLFVVATDAASSGRQRVHDGASRSAARSGRERVATRSDGRAAVADAARDGRDEGRAESARPVGGSDAPVGSDGPIALIPTPLSSDAGPRGGTTGYGLRDWSRGIDRGGALLPTPNAQDGNGGGRFNSAGHQTTLPGEARLLPTPRASQRGDCESERNRNDPALEATTFHFPNGQWGKYGPAIARWEAATRPAPAATEPNKNGNPRLSAAFAEWLMGWPAGWVTDVPGISRNDALRIVGNGVVPQQAAAAITYLLNIEAANR